ncbi:MAG: hypothetical protein OSJ63_08045 [Bacilli bacterium]|nr:hypothetical protein [Bacilli bacterium]
MKRIKSEINNNISPKTYLVIAMFALVMFICSFAVTIKYYIAIKDYVKINATIIESGYRYTGPSSEESKINYIKVKYEYKNKEYNKELRITDFLIKYPKVGNNRTILINPNNPEEVDNHYMRIACSIASVLLLIFTLFIFNAYRIKNKTIN